MRTSHFLKLATICLVAAAGFFRCPDLSAGAASPLKGPLYDPIIPETISIDVELAHYFKFLKNNIELYTSEHETIGEHSKKKVAAAFSWKDADGQTRSAKGTVRVNGDVTDHVGFAHGRPYTSLVARLKSGNIGGLTRFKLLIPKTRSGAWEIFATAFFEKLGYPSPFTRLITLRLNGDPIPMLFQEQIRKELLERYGLREAPIIEGAERQWWLEKYHSFPEHNDAAFQPEHRCCYASLDNGKLARAPGFHGIIQNGLTLYNSAIEGYNPYFHTIDMRFADDSYRELMMTLGAMHGVATTNRKFYYEPLYNRLIPIYYDGEISPERRKKLQPLMLNAGILSRLKTDAFYREVLEAHVARGGDNISAVETYLKTFRAMVQAERPKLDKTTSPYLANTFFPDDGYDPTPSPRHKEIAARPFHQADIKAPFVFSARRPGEASYALCYLNADLAYGEVQAGNLSFSGREKIECQTIGRAFFQATLTGLATFVHQGETRLINTMGNIKLVKGGMAFKQIFQTGLKVLPEKELPAHARVTVAPNQTLWIDFDVSGKTRVELLDIQLRTFAGTTGRVILSGDLTHLRMIQVAGAPSGQEKTSRPSRFDDRLLTGCLTLLDAQMGNLSINAQSLGCEDAVNIVRSTGGDLRMKVSDAGGDALDVDFSTLAFAEISVRNAGNDCIDLSAGTYAIDKATLAGCGDKGISIGERSQARIAHAAIDGAEIGVASKDSSRAIVDAARLRNVKTCFAAYNKKQEFDGGTLRVTTPVEGCETQTMADLQSILEIAR